MSASPQRARVHPRERFAGSEKLFQLDREFGALPDESTVHGGHMQKALYRHKTVTTAIFAFEPGGWIDEHETECELTILVLEGKLFVTTEESEYTLGRNEMLLLNPGVKHDIKAVEPTRLLMTFVQIETDGG
jgi:quercetin dioxygenase-like cupin family protein